VRVVVTGVMMVKHSDHEFSMWTNSEAAYQLKPIKKLPRIEKEIAIKIALNPRIGY